MNYSAERLMQIFGVGRHSAAVTPAEAERLAHDERAIAERVYGLGNPRKALELGNKEQGDGFRYRGCGLMQTTGRFNFRLMGCAGSISSTTRIWSSRRSTRSNRRWLNGPQGTQCLRRQQ